MEFNNFIKNIKEIILPEILQGNELVIKNRINAFGEILYTSISLTIEKKDIFLVTFINDTQNIEIATYLKHVNDSIVNRVQFSHSVFSRKSVYEQALEYIEKIIVEYRKKSLCGDE